MDKNIEDKTKTHKPVDKAEEGDKMSLNSQQKIEKFIIKHEKDLSK